MSWLNTPNSQVSLSVPSVDEEDTDYYTDAPLPSPINTPYRTPQLSRKSSYQHEPTFAPSPPPGRSSSPNYQHPHQGRFNLMAPDPAMDETISLLDPRRFTPTLHANLVAEILSLRRELESKAQFIDSLEQDLSKARSEQESATTSIATAQREAREVKRKLAAAENDTAVESIVKERDNAVETIGELRRQVERLTRSRRIAEEEAERTRNLAERDAERWEEVKRGLERRAHVAEGRLKVVLEELAVRNTKSQDEHRPDTAETEGTDNASIHMAGSDTASIRTISRDSYRPQSFMAGDDVAERFGVRFSHLGFGQSLADELNFPNEESEEIEEEDEEVEEAVELEEDMEEGEEDELDDQEEDEEEAGGYLSEYDEPDGMLTPMQLERVPISVTEVAVQTEEEYPEPQPPATVVDPQQQLLLAEKEAELARVIERITELEEKLLMKEKEVAEWERQDEERNCLLREKEEKLAQTETILAGKEQKLEEQDMRLEELSLFVETSLKEVTKENNMVTTGMQTSEAEAEAKRKSMSLPPPKTYTYGCTQTDPLPPPPPPKSRSLPPWPPRPPPKPPVSVGTQTSFPPKISTPAVSSGTQTDVVEVIQKSEVVVSTSSTQTDAETKPAILNTGTQTDVEPQRQPKFPPVFASTQTDPDSRPTSPKKPEVPLLVSIGIQTDLIPSSPPPALDRPAPPPPLLRVIPTIQVIPPPPTPPLVSANPVMRENSCQTTPPSTRSISIQTDEEKSDTVKVTKLPPTLLPSALLASTAPLPLPDTGPAPSLPRRSSKRVTRKGSESTPVLETNAVLEGILTEEPTEDLDLAATPPPINKGKGKARDSFAGNRPNRTSGLFATPSIDNFGSSDDESLNLSDGEYKTVLSAPKPRKRFSIKNNQLPEKSARQSSIRRNALIISGSQVHASSSRAIARTPSLTNGSSNSAAIGPPFPVPTRFSSRKVTPTGSERTQSPTPINGGLTRSTARKRNPSLRKSRSATTLSTMNSVKSDLSPPGPSSIAPESLMPPPLPLPQVEIRSPAFPTQSYETKFQTRYSRSENKSENKSDAPTYQTHRPQGSATTSATGNATVESTQQTSVVDAIAQTMVGEWMWKYVRRRKSFGVADSPNGWDGRDDSTGGGQRHKRWVWLAPYERAVMWSSRQPTSGNALLGKSGRKLPIQSVLDVKDDTPLPKGVSPTPIFNRSILILTPARALKFTAPSKERHYVWLTALSFLSHSAQEADGLLALPPPMPFEYEQVQQQQGQVTPTRIVTERDTFAPLRPRDSIRVAKGKAKNGADLLKTNKPKGHARDESVAEPPSIPRYPGQHARKRSNTGSRPSVSRGFTTGFVGTGPYNGSMTRDSIYYGNGVVGGIGIPSTNSSMMYGSTGGGSTISGWDTGVGTVRMEAFVDKKSKSEVDEDSLYNIPTSYQLRRERQRREQWSPPGFDLLSGINDDDFFRSNDPFRGF